MASTVISKIRTRWLRLLREERGSATLWLVVGMVPMVGFAAVAIDVGTIAVAKAKLQRAAEAGAHAGAKAMRDGEGGPGAELRATQVFLDNTNALNASVDDANVGSYDLASGVFTNGFGLDGVPAVEIQASAQVPLVFAPVVGLQSASFEVDAIYGGRKREVVIVQDVSGSFGSQINAAKDADRALVQQMSDQDMPGDRVGVVRYASSANTVRPLTDLDTGTALLLNSISGIPCCGGGTRTDLGILAAIDLFQFSDPAETERVIIIVTDGQPTGAANAQALAEDAADDADAEAIHVFTLLLNANNSAAARESNEDLVRGAGTARETADPAALEDLLLEILAALPILLVR